MGALIAIDGTSAGLTVKAVAAIARDDAFVELSPGALERNARARQGLARVLAEGGRVYGATTGVGALRTAPVDPGEGEQMSLRLLRSHAGGAGPQLPVADVRAAMAVRAGQL
ncbi:MAG: aromatic amino acid lyase, partial [Solirubrobacteraceae bacterium]